MHVIYLGYEIDLFFLTVFSTRWYLSGAEASQHAIFDNYGEASSRECLSISVSVGMGSIQCVLELSIRQGASVR